MIDLEEFIYAMVYKSCTTDDLYDDIHDELLTSDEASQAWIVKQDLWVTDRKEVLLKGQKIAFWYGKWHKV